MKIDAPELRLQRERPSVLKLQLSHLRSKHQCALVFVLEGREDLRAYESWLQRGTPEVKWEPLVANGKRNTLPFLDMMRRDATGLSVCTYFIVDHDYDGLDGRRHGSDVYVLSAHSIENYLTHEQVVASLLRTEFRLLGEPDVRDWLLGLYEKSRGEFMCAVRVACVTLCATRRTSCGSVDIRENCMDFVSVTPGSVTVKDAAGLEALVTTEQTLVEADLAAADEFFDDNEALWIRGKYLAAFFRAWISTLMEDRQSDTPLFFKDASRGHVLSGGWNEVGSLAAKSPIPSGLIEFVRNAAAECLDICVDEAA